MADRATALAVIDKLKSMNISDEQIRAKLAPLSEEARNAEYDKLAQRYSLGTFAAAQPATGEKEFTPDVQQPLGVRIENAALAYSDRVKATALGAAETITFGQTARLAGAVDAASGLVSGTAKKDYERSRKDTTEAIEESKQELPGYFTTGEVIGFLTPLPTKVFNAGQLVGKAAVQGARQALTLGKAGKELGLIARTVSAAAGIGAGTAAVQAVTSTLGKPGEERPSLGQIGEETLAAGESGAIFGGGLSLAGSTVRGVGKAGVGILKSMLGPEKYGAFKRADELIAAGQKITDVELRKVLTLVKDTAGKVKETLMGSARQAEGEVATPLSEVGQAAIDEVDRIAGTVFEAIGKDQRNIRAGFPALVTGIKEAFEGATQKARVINDSNYAEVLLNNEGTKLPGKQLSQFIFGKLKEAGVIKEGTERTLDGKNPLVRDGIALFKRLAGDAEEFEKAGEVPFDRALDVKQSLSRLGYKKSYFGEKVYAELPGGAGPFRGIVRDISAGIKQMLVEKDSSGSLEKADQAYMAMNQDLRLFAGAIGRAPEALESRLEKIYSKVAGKGDATIRRKVIEQGLKFAPEMQAKVQKNLDVARRYSEMQVKEARSATAIGKMLRNALSGTVSEGKTYSQETLARMEKMFSGLEGMRGKAEAAVRAEEANGGSTTTRYLRMLGNVSENTKVKDFVQSRAPQAMPALERLETLQTEARNINNRIGNDVYAVAKNVFNKEEDYALREAVGVMTAMFPEVATAFQKLSDVRLATKYFGNEKSAQGAVSALKALGAVAPAYQAAFMLQAIYKSPKGLSRLIRASEGLSEASANKIAEKAGNALYNLTKTQIARKIPGIEKLNSVGIAADWAQVMERLQVQAPALKLSTESPDGQSDSLLQ